MLRQGLASLRLLPRDARLYIGAEALSAFAAGTFGAVYNLYVLALGFDTALLGTLLVVATVGAGAAVIPAGALVDRFGPRPLLLGGSLVAGAGVGAQLLLPTAPLLLAGNALAGAGAAAFYVAAAPFLARAAPAGARETLFSLDTAAVLAGTAAGSVAGGQMAALLGPAGAGQPAESAYRIVLLLGGAAGALSFPLLLATSRGTGPAVPAPPAGPAVAPGDPQREPRPGDQEQVEGEGAPGGTWRAALRDPVAVRLALTTTLIGLGAGLFIPFLNVYFVEVLGASPAVYGWVSGAGTLTRLGATLLAPALATRVGTAGAIAGTQLASVPFLLLLGFAPQLGVAAGAVLARGALMNMAAPLQAGFTMGALTPALRGTANALLLLAGNGSRALSTLAGGVLIQQAGYRLPYALTALLYTVAALLFWAWFGERDRARPGEPGPASVRRRRGGR